MSEFSQADFARLNSILSEQGLISPGESNQSNSKPNSARPSVKNSTEVLLKTVRYMTPTDKLRTNKKLLGSVMSFKEALLRNLMNKHRSDNEAWSLYEYVKDFKFFQQYVNIETIENEAVLHICKNIKYEKYKKDSVIFREGDPSNGKVYILFDGSIKVIVSKLDVYEKENTENTSPLKKKGIKAGDISSASVSLSGSEAQSKVSSRRTSLRNQNTGLLALPSPQSPKARRSVNVGRNRDKFLKMYTLGDSLEDDTPNNNTDEEHVPRKSKFHQDDKSLAPDTDEGDKNAKSSKRTSIIFAPLNLDGINTDSNEKSNSLDPNLLLKTPSKKKSDMHRFALLKSAFETDKMPILTIPPPESASNSDRDSKIHPLGYVRTIISDRGAFFGEKALEDDAKRGASIVAHSELELLVLTKEVFGYIKKAFDKEKRMLKEYMMKYIPNLDIISSPQILSEFMFLFKDVPLDFGNHIVSEGDVGENIYMLYQGTAEVYRTVIVHEVDYSEVSIKKVKEFYATGKKTKENIVLAGISEGAFIGDELLIKDTKKYLYSIKVTSDRARVLCTTKLKINARFPEESQRKLRETILDKKNQRDNLLVELLNKRSLKSMTESLDVHPLVARRQKINDSFHGVEKKVNAKLSMHNSYTYLSPRVETAQQSPSSNVQTAKLPSFDEESMRRTQNMLSFSRKNYMPIKQGENDKKFLEFSRDGPLEKSVDRSFTGINPKRVQTPQNQETKKINPLRSDESNHEYKNINQYYDQVLEKFGINNLLKDAKDHMNDVKYFKLDFDGKIKKKNRLVINTEHSRYHEKALRGRATEEPGDHDYKFVTNYTQGSDSIDNPPTISSKNFDFAYTNHSRDTIESPILNKGNQILMPLFSDRKIPSYNITRKSNNFKEVSPTLSRTMGQLPGVKSPRTRIPTKMSNIPANTQKLINKLRKNMNTRGNDDKKVKKVQELPKVSILNSPKKVYMEICYMSGLQSARPYQK